VLLGDTVTLTATVSNATDTAVSWNVAGIPGGDIIVGTISANGVFTAPSSLPVPATEIVQATSLADPTKSAAATIIITSDVAVSISPAAASIELGAQQEFLATISSAAQPSTAVNWTITGNGCAGTACGTVNASGLFTAPQILPSSQAIALIATSVADPSKMATAAVTLTSRFAFSLSGPSAISAGASANFTASLVPIPNSNPSAVISWSLSGAGCAGSACGTIIALGSGAAATYTAPAAAPSPNQITITATPAADPSKAASIAITIASTVSLSISPTAATLALGASTNFAATVTGAADSSVTWDVNGIAGGNATVGTILPDGNPGAATYTAPAIMPASNPLTVHASSNTNPNVTAAATVTLIGAIAVALTPPSATLSVNNRQTFNVQIVNSATSEVSWQVNGVPGGNTTVGQVCVVGSSPCQTVTSSVAASVDFLAPAAVPSPNPVTLKAISQDNSTVSASSSITILPHDVVSVSPPSVTLAPGALQTFVADVLGTTDQQVTWSISGAACSAAGAPCGIVDATGSYVAPAIAPSPNTLSVTATSSEDTSRTASAAVTITLQPTILSLQPASITAGAGGGFTLLVTGGNFLATSPGPGSSLLVGGSARITVCDSTSSCTTTLGATDLAVATNLSVTVQNPNGSVSNAVAFVVAPVTGSTEAIPLTPGAPSAANNNISVVDLSTNGSPSPAEDVSLNVAGMGPYQPATGTCTLGAGPVTLTRPASGTATADICVFSVSGLDPSLTFTLSGPSPSDVIIAGKQPIGLGFVDLTLQVPSTALAGVRTLFIQNANLDTTSATGAIEIR
jgi:hypothetical protein